MMTTRNLCTVVILGLVVLILGSCRKQGITPSTRALLDAASRQDIRTAKRALDAGADIDGQDFREGYGTALHRAASAGDLDLIRLLLERGANVESTKSPGITPLLAAAYERETDAAILLIERGRTYMPGVAA